MSVLDTLRIESAVQRFDLALDLAGVAGRQRRDLRRELRGNLRESARAGGARRALAAIGPPEQLARECAEALRDPRRPAWSLGFGWAMAAVALYWLLAFWSAFAFMDGVFASGVETEVTGRITLLPGVEAMARRGADGLSGGFVMHGPFWIATLVLFVVVLALAGRVWRPLRRRAS